MSTPDSSLRWQSKKERYTIGYCKYVKKTKTITAMLSCVRQGDYEMNMKEREIARKEQLTQQDARKQSVTKAGKSKVGRDIGIRRARAQTAADKAAADAA